MTELENHLNALDALEALPYSAAAAVMATPRTSAS
jgi:hypothetical protein